MLSDMARRWLAYARAIFACPAHHAQCDAPPVSTIDCSIRWPGFVGPSYERSVKKLLLLGRIHNPGGWNETSGLGTLEPLIHDWIDGRISDPSFYAEYNRRYAALLPTWGPWYKVYGSLAAAVGIDATGVAYANVAKCWQFPGHESAAQRACSSEFPVEDLIEVVKPDGVFLLAPASWVSRVSGAQVRSVPFMYDSAPHFQIPHQRMQEAVTWVRSL